MSQEAESPRNVIVVGADMEETGVHALQEGMRLAKQLPGSALHAVYVVDTPSELHDAKKIEELSERVSKAREQLREHVSKACRPEPPEEPFDKTVTLHVRLGKPAEAILQVAVDEEAELIVVGTHGRTGVKRWVMGSVAEELLHIARCPVVIAHPKHYEGLEKSDRVQPPRPGQDPLSSGYSEEVSLHFPQRTSHIAGLI